MSSSMESKCIDYNQKITEEYPCFEFWFSTDDGKIVDFEDDNHAIGLIHGLDLGVIWGVVEYIKDEIEGNCQEILPKDGKHVVTVKIDAIEWFGGQWSEDAGRYEIHPAYWFCVKLVSSKSLAELAQEMTPTMFDL